MSSYTGRATAACLLILSIGWGTTVQASAAPSEASPTTTAAAPPTTPASPPTAAQVGAGWLGRRFTKGGFIRSHGKGNVGDTAQGVLALAAAGVGARQASVAMAWLEDNFQSYVTDDGVDDPGALATVILAAQAMGVDPTAFGGTAPANNLVARLEATQQTSGSDVGLFGTADPVYDGAFRQGLSLMALANAGISNADPVVAAGVTWLQNQQCSDGGWQGYRSDLSTPCPSPDPGTDEGPDTNSTSLAVEALVATGSSFDVDPTSFFESAQNPDGGFGFIGAATESPDADSTGEVVQALVALDELGDAAFTQSEGATPATALASFQLGCSAHRAARGAFAYQPKSNGSLKADLLATLEAVPGSAEVAFPLGAQTPKAGLPTLAC
jgi:hypothetical protein